MDIRERYNQYTKGELELEKLLSYSVPSSTINDLSKMRTGTLGKRTYQPRQQVTIIIKSETTAAGFVANVPVVVSGENCDARIAALTERFLSQAFDDQSQCYSHLRVVFGANRMRSLDKSRNRSFKDAVKSSDHKALFGFFWVPRWKDANGKMASLKTVRREWTLLRELNPEVAEKVRKLYEEPGERVRGQVPYGSIRDTLKDHAITKRCFRDLTAISSERNLYLATLDPSVLDLCKVFSLYQSVIRESRRTLHILSSGFKLACTAPQALQLGIILDQRLRAVAAKRWFFHPAEPNSIFLKLPGTATVEESFCQKGTYQSLEGTHLAREMTTARGISRNTRRMLTEGAVIIEARKRYLDSPLAKLATIGPSNRGQENVRKALAGVSQSFFNGSNWTNSFLATLSVKYDRKRATDIRGMRLAYFPHTVARALSEGKYHKKFFEAVIKTYALYLIFLDKLEGQEELIASLHRILGIPRDVLESILAAQQDHLQGSIEALTTAGLKPIEISKLRITAAETGTEIIRTLVG